MSPWVNWFFHTIRPVAASTAISASLVSVAGAE
jgi:hypothetical protein